MTFRLFFYSSSNRRMGSFFSRKKKQAKVEPPQTQITDQDRAILVCLLLPIPTLFRSLYCRLPSSFAAFASF